jgi:large subunit ribosomal protein L4
MTLSLTVQNPVDDSAKGASIELPAEIFDVKTNISLIHQVVVAQLAAARQGTHKTKSRGEVRGGGKKPYRQKGTGRARQGSTRAPQFAGGGVVHGPVPRNYEQRTPKKMKAAALRGALSDRARNGRVHVVSSFVSGDVPSTSAASAALAKISDSRNLLVVIDRNDELTWKSLRNVISVHLIEPGQLNTYDVLVSDDVIFTQAALEVFLGGPATEAPAAAAEPTDTVETVDTEKKPAAKKAPAKKAPAKKAAAKTEEPGGNAEVAEVSSSDSADAAEPALDAEGEEKA